MTFLCAALLLQGSNFDKHVTEELKDVLASEAVAAIAKDASIECVYPKGYENTKVNVFARDIPAGALLDRIASTLGFVGAVKDGKYLLTPGPEFKGQTLTNYVAAEAGIRRQILATRLDALARLTYQPFGSVPPTTSGSDEDPKVWAAKRIDQPAYYALGMAARAGGLESVGRSGPLGMWHFLSRIIDGHSIAFKVGRPIEAATPDSYVDANSSAIEGTLISCGGLLSTAEFKLTVLTGAPLRAEPLSSLPYLFAAPPIALRKEKFAQLLAEWSMPAKEVATIVPVKDLVQKADTEDRDVETKEAGYFDGRTSLSDKLEKIHDETGISIVGTSFRTPAMQQKSGEYGEKTRAIESLAADEKCFLRAEDGVLLVRHPAYWLLRYTEPSEFLVRRLERTAATAGELSLNDYADLAFSIGQIADPGTADYSKGGYGLPHSYDRLIHLRGLLLRFDGTPLATAYPPLFLMGCLNEDGRKALLNGAVWGGSEITQTSSRSWRGSLSRAPHDLASAAPTFDAIVGLRYFTPAEAGVNVEEANRVAFERDVDERSPLVKYLDATSLALRARFVWLETVGPDDYIFKVGFRDVVTASFPVMWQGK